MKHPDRWRETIDPFSIPYKYFKLHKILGYPHAGNDVFYVKGTAGGEEISAFIKVSRQKGADIANEASVLSKLNLKIAPKIIEFCLEGTPFIVTEELEGERLSTIVGDNKKMESLPYMEEYGKTLAEFHQKRIKANPMKDRRFFPKPSKELLESLELENLENCLSKNS